MNKTLDQLRHEAKFSALRIEPVPIPGTPYKIRLPNAFFGNTGALFTLDSPDPVTGLPPLPPQLLQPGQMTIPGMHVVYQAAVLDERGVQLPYFCHIASIERGQEPPAAEAPAGEAQPAEDKKPAEEKKPEEKKPEEAASDEKKPADEKPEGDEKKAPVENQQEGEKGADEKPAAKPAKPVPLDKRLLAEVNKAFKSETPIKWEEVNCETPQSPAVKVPWRRLVAEGEQEFKFINSGIANTLPGKFELYLYDPPEQAFTVILVWRVPNAILPKAPIGDWAIRSAGTIGTN